MFKKLKQKLCKHKYAIRCGEVRTQLIGGGVRKRKVAKHYCVRCGKTFDKEVEE